MPISRKPLSKGEKSLFGACVFIIVPLAAVVYVTGSRDAEPKWDIPTAAPIPNPNGYDFYVAAANATVRFTPEVDPASDTTRTPNEPGSAYALKNYSLVRRQQWLKANARTFSLVNQGLTTPSMAPDYSSGAFGNWGKLRQLARDMGARTRTYQMAKEPMKATMSALDAMQMGIDTTRGGGLIASLVGAAIIAIAHQPLDDWDKTINQLNGSEARIAAKRLEALLAKQSTSTQVLTADKRDTLVDLRRIFASSDWRSTLTSTNFGEAPTLSQRFEMQTVSKQAIVNNINRVLDTRIANSKLTYSKALSASVPSDVDVFTKYLVGSGTRTIILEARDATSNNMLLMRLALRAYIADHGTAPPNLAVLVPTYLQSIPTDVYNDGKPLFYKPQGKTYKLWSVGPDRVNNGGVPLTPRSGGTTGTAKFPVANTLDNKGDFVAGLCR